MGQSDAPPIRVIVVDDHHMVRKGLTTVLCHFEDIELVGEGSDGQQAIQLCRETRPDVLLIDLIMPGMDGLTALRNIHIQQPEIQIIALTSFQDPHLIRSSFEAGAASFLLKEASVDDLIATIRAVAHGQPAISMDIAQVLMRSGDGSADEEVLTDRERDVLALMAEGLTNRQIAERLAISPYTVNAHASNIFAKLNVSSRTEAAAWAIKHDVTRPRSS